VTTRQAATAASAPVTIGGREFQASPLTDRDSAELDNWVQTRVIKTARDSLDEDTSEQERQETMDSANRIAQSMTWLWGDGAAILATPDGMARLAWQMCKDNHPGLAFEEIRAAILQPTAVDDIAGVFDFLHPALTAKKNDKPKAKKKRQKGSRKGKRKRRKS
jgi:hypothetical protein